jgi:hypothetical protein
MIVGRGRRSNPEATPYIVDPGSKSMLSTRSIFGDGFGSVGHIMMDDDF